MRMKEGKLKVSVSIILFYKVYTLLTRLSCTKYIQDDDVVPASITAPTGSYKDEHGNMERRVQSVEDCTSSSGQLLLFA